jgi:hypothetical protein
MRCPKPVLLALVLALASPATAHAQKPVREVLPVPPDQTTEACGFPVLAHVIGATVRTTWFDGQGNPVRAIETYPRSKYVLTNLQTQKQTQLSIVGPAFYEFRPDGSFTVTGTGPWGWYPENPVTGEPGIFHIRGRLTYTVDAAGNFSFDLIAGDIVNVCPRLT